MTILPEDAVLPLVLFMALVLAASLYGLTASGHFPRQHRAPALARGLGPLILFGSIAIVIVCCGVATTAAMRLIPWYAAVIGGGLAILSAPLILPQFPDRFVDGRSAVIAFAVATVAFAALLVGSMAGGPFRP